MGWRHAPHRRAWPNPWSPKRRACTGRRSRSRLHRSSESGFSSEDGRADSKNRRSISASSMPCCCASCATNVPTPSERVGPGSTLLTVMPVPGNRLGEAASECNLRGLCYAVVNHFDGYLQARFTRYNTTRPQLRARMPGRYARDNRTRLTRSPRKPHQSASSMSSNARGSKMPRLFDQDVGCRTALKDCRPCCGR